MAPRKTCLGRAVNRRVELVVLIGDGELDIVPKFAGVSTPGGSEADQDGTTNGDSADDSTGIDERVPEPSIVDIAPNVDPNLPSGS